MNICIIAPRYPYKDNMSYVFVKKIVDEWVKAGHSCDVVSPFSLTSYLRRRIDYRPLHYRDVIEGNTYVDVYNPREITTAINLLDSYLSASIVKRQIHKLRKRYDLIYCHFFVSSYKVFRFAKRYNIPLFVATGESSLSKLGALNIPFLGFNYKEYRSFLRGVIAVSSNNKKEAIEKGLVEEDKCMVLPNGTDLNRFYPRDKRECREQLGLPQDAFIVCCVGFICERKGQNRVLEAVRVLNNDKVRVLFVGAAAKVDSFELCGDEILFNGSVDNKDVPVFLSASDVFCLPTLQEGCCNAIIEAMACGLPIVSSDLPFNYDVLDSRNSILVDPRDVHGISEAIRELYENEAKRVALSSAGLERSKSLSIEQRANTIMSFIESRMR